MNLIITRPIGDAMTLARQIAARGHVPIFAPLLKIEARHDAQVPDATFQAICVTSANGFINAELLAPLRSLPVYCVGPQSARAAHAAGFAAARQRGGDVSGLVHAVTTELSPGAGDILYVSGDVTSGDLEGALSGAGFRVHRVIAYAAVPLPLALSAAQWASAHGVMLYSARSARLWADAIVSCGSAGRLTHYCLSANVARSLPAGFAVQIADVPDEEHMLSMLDQASEAE
jgi:uroporphyrinogen-III synthase